MDDQTTDLVKSVVAGQARHLCTYAAGALVTYGIVAPADSANVTTVLTGIAIGAVGQLWSWWQKAGQAQLKAELAKLRARLSVKTAPVPNPTK